MITQSLKFINRNRIQKHSQPYISWLIKEKLHRRILRPFTELLASSRIKSSNVTSLPGAETSRITMQSINSIYNQIKGNQLLSDRQQQSIQRQGSLKSKQPNNSNMAKRGDQNFGYKFMKITFFMSKRHHVDIQSLFGK